jgi:hypothetical protein
MWVPNKCICRSFIHSYYVRGAVSPKPSVADYVPPCKETYVQKVVELGLIATEVKYPLLRACSTSAALIAAGNQHSSTHTSNV